MIKNYLNKKRLTLGLFLTTLCTMHLPNVALANGTKGDPMATTYSYILGMAGFAINIVLSLTILYCVVGFINASTVLSKAGDDPRLKDAAIHKVKICFIVIVAAVNFYPIYGMIVAAAA